MSLERLWGDPGAWRDAEGLEVPRTSLGGMDREGETPGQVFRGTDGRASEAGRCFAPWREEAPGKGELASPSGRCAPWREVLPCACGVVW